MFDYNIKVRSVTVVENAMKTCKNKNSEDDLRRVDRTVLKDFPRIER